MIIAAASFSQSATSSQSPSSSATPSQSASQTKSESETASVTPTPSLTQSPSQTVSPTATVSQAQSASASQAVTATGRQYATGSQTSTQVRRNGLDACFHGRIELTSRLVLQACGAYVPSYGTVYNITAYSTAGTPAPYQVRHCSFQLFGAPMVAVGLRVPGAPLAD